MGDAFSAIEAVAGRPLLIGLDRDGTLVPYAERPEQAIAEPELVELLDRLASIDHNSKIAIVSARSVAQLSSDFEPAPLILAGNYGMEIKFPGAARQIAEFALAAAPELRHARDAIARRLTSDMHAIFEDHGYYLCLHWHTVPAQFRPLLHELVIHALIKRPSLKMRMLPTSYEIVPSTPWTKADALCEIENALGVAPTLSYRTANEKYYRIFIGDSDADEPAFAWANSRQGLSIRVAPHDEHTCARFKFRSPTQVREFLEHVARTKRSALVAHSANLN